MRATRPLSPETNNLPVAANTTLTVRVELQKRSYEIAISTGDLSGVAAAVERWAIERNLVAASSTALTKGTVFLVTDTHLQTTHAETVRQALTQCGWRCDVEVLPFGETTKSQEQANRLYDRLIDLSADRKTIVVAVGGGVIGDLAGFVASTYARGLAFVQIPTSLLSQVDSSVGGKVGINHPRAKNMIGSFHQPIGVYIDTTLLDTLPVREYRAGLAEVVKYGVILDAEFFEYLEQHVTEINARVPQVVQHMVAQSCQLKADVVEKDEYETTGLRAVLNYGHTFAHAFEALCGYGELLHGEAVSIGMAYASRLADRLQRIPHELTVRQEQLLLKLGLPIRLPPFVDLSNAALLQRMQLDKKSVGGKLRFVLPTRLGHVELVSGVSSTDVEAVLDELRPR